jgi:N-acylneuraminate cytidylyltransferase
VAEHGNANTIIRSLLPHIAGQHFGQFHVTSPLLTAATVDRAVQAYFAGLDAHDSLFSVTAHQSWFYTADGAPMNHVPGELKRSQDMAPIYEDNSAIHLFSRESFERSGARVGLSPQMFPIERIEAVDIDEEGDFEMAEALLLGLDAKRRQMRNPYERARQRRASSRMAVPA